MAKKATPTASTETLEPRIYEIGYLLSPAVRDEDLAARIGEIKETLTNLGATFISEGAPEYIDLAYQMVRVIDNKNVRFDQAYFGWIKFELDPAAIAAVKEWFDKNVLIIRHLLTLAVRENTVIGKRPLGKILKGDKREASTENEPAQAAPAAETGIVPETAPSEENVDAALDSEIKEMVKEA